MGKKDKVKAGQFLGAVEAHLSDWDPRIPVAQAALESGWFSHVIGWNNYFGMKYPRSEKRRAMIDREPVRVSTHEYIKLAVIKRKPGYLASFLRQNIGELIDVRYERARERYKIQLYARFADWTREQKAIEYWEQYMKDVMPNAYAGRKDPRRFVRGLFSGRLKYATCDPDEYEKTFMAVIGKLKRDGSLT